MMQKKIRRELNKLRELVLFLLREKDCALCHQPLTDYDGRVDGDGCGVPLTERITIHHSDGNHANKALSNQVLVHETCHKAYHARIHPRAGGRFTNKQTQTAA
jgi:hypothetical protein